MWPCLAVRVGAYMFIFRFVLRHEGIFFHFALLFESVNNALPGLGLGVDLSVTPFVCRVIGVTFC